MKKILLILISILLLININACAGYKPIFGSSDLNFDIADYTITGDKQLGNQIYARLVNLSKKNSDKSKSKQLLLLINVTKSKSHTAKDEAGKILGYKISLSTKVTATDYLTEDKLMNVNFNFSSSSLTSLLKDNISPLSFFQASLTTIGTLRPSSLSK